MPDFSVHPLELCFLGAPQAIAAYLVQGPAGPLLAETGPGSTRSNLVAELARFGLEPGQVRHVLLTHIHLDHAGAAGWWTRQGATVYVHHLGAPHLIDPGRLLSSAQRIYGDQMEPLWGEFLSALPERVQALHDGAVIEAGGLRLVAHDTPGHASHHFVYQLGDVAFAGDLGGVRRPDSGYIRLPTPPPEFDLPAWQASVARMQALGLRRIYLTHFGPVDDPAAHWAEVSHLLPEYAGLVRVQLEAGNDRSVILQAIEAWEQQRLAAAGVAEAAWPVYASLGPASMAADGLIRYWQKQGVGSGA